MYIRTKDGVYEVEQSQLEDDEEVVNCDYGQIHKLEILRKSENLEELCDEFIDENQHYIIQNKNIIKEIPNKSALKNHRIYGAIWTSKGLIYVAKMNDKGELCLL